MRDTVVIITGSAPSPDMVRTQVPTGAVVVAADSGLDHARNASLAPDVVVGDLDSVSPEGAAWAHEHGEVRSSPTDKATTDTELAIEVALSYVPRRLIVIGGPDGTRLDHTLAALGALGQPSTDVVDVVAAWWGANYVRVVRPSDAVTFADVEPGRTFSVLALHGGATGVTVTGARWPLDAVELPPLSGWGVSNEAAAPPPVTVAVDRGVLTVIVPPGEPT
ncbi:thiamine diphosphokinase [soil metagenome]